MKLLDRAYYGKLNEPLNQVPFNSLFARAVVEKKITGKIYVDNHVNPATFYVVHPYGMTLLFGNSHNKSFNQSFRSYALNLSHERDGHEWMQVYPDNWNVILNELFKGCLVKSADNSNNRETGIIEINTRVNFKFSYEKYKSQRKSDLPDGAKIVRTGRQAFRDTKGSVAPIYFWESEDDFLKNGVGFSLFYHGKLASTAFSSCMHEHKLELGIETIDEFRGKGFAVFACCALIDYCIASRFEPVWACRLENAGSYKLAQKVGFLSSLRLPYYRLSK